jgi:hypothetical protein
MHTRVGTQLPVRVKSLHRPLLTLQCAVKILFPKLTQLGYFLPLLLTHNSVLAFRCGIPPIPQLTLSISFQESIAKHYSKD